MPIQWNQVVCIWYWSRKELDNAGCPDMNGVVAVKTKPPPNVTGFAVSGSKLEPAWYQPPQWEPINPFRSLPEVQSKLHLSLLIHGWNPQATDPVTTTVKRNSFFTDKDDFSNSSVLVASTYSSLYFIWLAILPSCKLVIGTTVYFLIYTWNDLTSQ